MNKLRKMLQKEMDSKGYSRRALALKMKLAPQSINNYMDSPTEPMVASLQKIADYFHKPVSFFLEDEPPKPEEGTEEKTEQKKTTEPIASHNSGLKYNQHNVSIHDDVENILNSGDQEAIGAFKFGLKGVLRALEEKSESVILLRRIAEGMDKLLESEADLGGVAEQGSEEVSSPPTQKAL